MIESQKFWGEQSNLRHLLEDIWCARQPATVKMYCYAIRKFFSFCTIFGHDISLPVGCNLAASYISFVRRNFGSRGAVSSAINALKWLHNFVPGINQFNDPLNDKMLKLVVDSALRNLPKIRRAKTPLPSDLISSIVSDGLKADVLIEVRNCLIVALAYVMLFRHDEIAHISCNHLSLISGGVSIWLPSCKTDVYKSGNTALLSKGGVFSLLKKYMHLASLRFGEPHFLFGPIEKRGAQWVLQNQKLSYNSYRKVLRSLLTKYGYNADHYGFHSCRSGGASSLAPHVTKAELQSAGRWKDPRSLSSYVKISDKRRLEFSRVLSN